MTEFLFGYVAGLGTTLIAGLVISFVAVSSRNEDPEPESQDDIRLTKIKSRYLRHDRHD
jgi:hypothetical protein